MTAKGLRAVEAITAARRRLLGKMLADWSVEDRETLARLNRKLADSMRKARSAWERGAG